MNFKNLTVIGAALLLSAPMFGSTYFGGFEDTKGGDYDYNDIVFSLSGTGLTLNSSGSYYAQPNLNNSGVPFWNNLSQDNPAASYNVGYCIYGGGACNGGTALAPGAKFLASASSPAMSANDVTFSVNGNVNANITLGITAGNETLGYYLVSDPTHTVHLLGAVGNTYSFTPGGDFGLATVVSNYGLTYYSQTAFGAADTMSHFAFFAASQPTPAPEPGAMGMVAAGMLGAVSFLRRKVSKA